MATNVWELTLSELKAARRTLLESPMEGLPAVEETLERVRQRWTQTQALPAAWELAEMRKLLAEVGLYGAQGAELVEGWRAALGALVGLYDAGGAPVNEIFANRRISRVG